MSQEILKEAFDVLENGTVADLDAFAKANSIKDYDESDKKPEKKKSLKTWIDSLSVIKEEESDLSEENKVSEEKEEAEEKEEIKTAKPLPDPKPIADANPDPIGNFDLEPIADIEPDINPDISFVDGPRSELNADDDVDASLEVEKNIEVSSGFIPAIEQKEDNSIEQIANIKSIRSQMHLIDCVIQGHSSIQNKIEEDMFNSRAWLGIILGELGAQNPYKKDETEIKDESQIPPTADVNAYSEMDLLVFKRDFSLMNKLEAVIKARTDISNLIDKIRDLHFTNSTREIAIARTNAYTYLCNAKFKLGRILSSFRKN